jgi:hypothetical protein
MRGVQVLEFEGEITVSPFGKIQAISDVYFPQFGKAVEDLGTHSNALANRPSLNHVPQNVQAAGVYNQILASP